MMCHYCTWQAADMASSSSSPALSQSHLLVNSVVARSYNSIHKTSPSSTDTASCSQDDDDVTVGIPLELTSHAARLIVACTSSTTSPVSVSVTSVPPHPQLTLAAANTLRWTTHGYEICSAPSNLPFSAYCDAAALTQTGTSYSRSLL